MNTFQFKKDLLNIQANMMNFALSLTANQKDAQDLTQETTLKVLTNQEKFKDNVNFKGWVLTVMRNIFINNYRKVIKQQTVIDPRIDLYNLDGTDNAEYITPENIYEANEIQLAIDHLSRDTKLPFTMYIDGFKYNEIAKILQIPLGTVKSRIFFARKELQKLLPDYRSRKQKKHQKA